MGGRPYPEDLAAEAAALTSRRAGLADAAAWLALWLLLLAFAAR